MKLNEQCAASNDMQNPLKDCSMLHLCTFTFTSISRPLVNHWRAPITMAHTAADDRIATHGVDTSENFMRAERLGDAPGGVCSAPGGLTVTAEPEPVAILLTLADGACCAH